MRLAVVLVVILMAGAAFAGSWRNDKGWSDLGWDKVLVYEPDMVNEPSQTMLVSHCKAGVVVACYGAGMTGFVYGMVCHEGECQDMILPRKIECGSGFLWRLIDPIEWVQIRDIAKSGNGQKFVIECIP